MIEAAKYAKNQDVVDQLDRRIENKMAYVEKL